MLRILDSELWFSLCPKRNGEACESRTGSNMVESMVWADLSATDLPQLGEDQDFRLRIQLVKT